MRQPLQTNTGDPYAGRTWDGRAREGSVDGNDTVKLLVRPRCRERSVDTEGAGDKVSAEASPVEEIGGLLRDNLLAQACDDVE